MSKMIIIGLLGPAGAGKSSIAAYLEKYYGAKRYSLAGPLKEIAKRTLGFSDEQLYGTQEQKEAIDPRYGFSCRSFLQRLGTEGCRAVLGDDVWTQACLKKIEDDRGPLAVIEDVRFVNEAQIVSGRRGFFADGLGGEVQYEGHVWKIVPPRDATAEARVAGAGVHASEEQWTRAKSDWVIAPGVRGLDDLYKFVDEAARCYGLARVNS